MQITAEYFKEKTGQDPEHDDLDLCNCKQAGETGHHCCGWCDKHDMPVLMCGCMTVKIVEIARLIENNRKVFLREIEWRDKRNAHI